MKIKTVIDFIIDKTVAATDNAIHSRIGFDYRFNAIANGVRYYDTRIKNKSMDIETYETLSNAFKDRLGFSYEQHIEGKYQYYIAQMFTCFIVLFNKSGYGYTYLKYKKEISIETERKYIIQKYIESFYKNRYDISISCIIRLMELDNVSINDVNTVINLIYQWEKEQKKNT